MSIAICTAAIQLFQVAVFKFSVHIAARPLLLGNFPAVRLIRCMEHHSTKGIRFGRCDQALDTRKDDISTVCSCHYLGNDDMGTSTVTGYFRSERLKNCKNLSKGKVTNREKDIQYKVSICDI
ncbi:unnamed protein product [Albugo candida]|uniref:Uncharacterized protein n=1 Tax=Albugo candida TaxID=65357 RepID=A0A024GIT3_9STRA|nr:unnamed protein product [Albugo candida]|eukprot:CCI46402.1 unnamed protein product [Albugo candida]